MLDSACHHPPSCRSRSYIQKIEHGHFPAKWRRAGGRPRLPEVPNATLARRPSPSPDAACPRGSLTGLPGAIVCLRVTTTGCRTDRSSEPVLDRRGPQRKLDAPEYRQSMAPANRCARHTAPSATCVLWIHRSAFLLVVSRHIGHNFRHGQDQKIPSHQRKTAF